VNELLASGAVGLFDGLVSIRWTKSRIWMTHHMLMMSMLKRRRFDGLRQLLRQRQRRVMSVVTEALLCWLIKPLAAVPYAGVGQDFYSSSVDVDEIDDGWTCRE